jgi:hypothetical protein
MTAISQRTPNFLGGVSQQVDERLFPGQVRQALNAYPDPAYGLTKRAGGRLIAALKDASGVNIPANTYANASWFSIFRDEQEKYMGNVNAGQVNIWSILDGSRKTVTMSGSAAAYIQAADWRDLNFLTVNDYTFITNDKVVVKALAAPPYTAGTNATIRLLEVAYSALYTVTIDGKGYTYQTRNADDNVGASDPPKELLNADDILNALKTAIAGGGYTVTRTGTSLEISSTAAIKVTAKGGQSGASLVAYQGSVDNIAKLSAESVQGRVVEITNSSALASSYYVKFFANDGVSGPGYWEETIKPGISTGLDPATMPHELVRNADGTFTVRPITWEPRLVGDDESNSQPSFVGHTIRHPFFFNNRLGFLSEDNVVMSQAGEYFNFYFTTATTLVAADPIDISCSSVKPAVLHAVVPTTQGLLLFSQNQQFMMGADNNIWSPTTTTIKTISNFECDPLVHPSDLGTTVVFTSKNPSYTRLFEMMTRGQEENPQVIDQARIVSEWIPAGQDQLVTSPQNSIVSLARRTSNTLYMWRFLEMNDKREMTAWVQWDLVGNVQHHAINADVMVAVTEQSDSYVLQDFDLTQSPSASGLISTSGVKTDPCLDMWSAVKGTYDAVTKKTTYRLPFKYEKGKTICLVTGSPTTMTYTESGYISFPTVLTDVAGSYIELKGNLTKTTTFIGYTFDFEVTLPNIYYRQEDANIFPSSFIISRMKIYAGLGGNLNFSIKARGRSEWKEASVVKAADFYQANDTPINSQHVYTIPIMQRSENFILKLSSNLPFPVSLVSMVCEGQYSSRFYQRR